MINSFDITLFLNHFNKRLEHQYNDDVHLTSSLAWLKQCQDRTGSGGVAGFYSIFKGWYDAYPETTGYIIQTFVDYYKKTNDEEFLSRAIRMGDWEVDIQLPDGSVRGYCLKKGISNTPLVFDTGQVLLGWVSLYRATGQQKYLDAAVKASLWLIKHQLPDGTWDKFLYKGHCGTYFSRVAWGMLQTAKSSARDDVRNGAVKFLDWVLSQQSNAGFFSNIGFTPTSHNFTHNISYTIEGLIGASEEIDDEELRKKYIASALKTSQKLLQEFSRKETLFGEYHFDFSPVNHDYICVTGTIQIAWVFLKLYVQSKNIEYWNTAVMLLEEAKSVQMIKTGNPAFDGSIVGSYPVWGSYQSWRLVSWSAKFFADALMEKMKILSEYPDLHHQKSAG
jgi:hypothetical protein